jgi:three-Cys-motif partner protein
MRKKSNVKNTLQIHSQAKVEFYSTYLNRYLRILYLSKYIKRINIYDVFCGVGVYEGGGKGSPIAAFNAIKSMFTDGKISKNNTQITLVFNDSELHKIEQVKNYIDNANQNFCEVRYYNYDIKQMFNEIQQEISRTANDTRNLIFIDPYGYKDIKKETLYNLMENRKTEIILFLPISHMHRFTQKAIQDEATVQYEPLRKFVNSFFHANHEMIKKQLPVMKYIQYISEALKYDNKFYTTSYYIERDAVNHFALFFMSSHIFGFEKILEVKWQLDEEAGRGFKIPSQQMGLFDAMFAEEAKNKNAEKLEEILLQTLSESKTNRQIYEITLKNEFLPKHATEIFEKWQSRNQKFKVYDIKTGDEARKKSFYISWNNYKEDKDKVKFIIEKQ